MLRSMYAGVSGMRNFQTKLDVIGNNIANVNTVGFKKGRITFQDMMSQMTAAAQGATANRGGINAMQVGTGSQLGSIDNIHTQGHRQTSNNTLDLMLEGDGMFVVSLDGETDGSRAYTRAGNFNLDSEGNLVTEDGNYVMGFAIDENGDPSSDFEIINIPINGGDTGDETVESFSIQKDGTITYVDGDGTQQDAGQLALALFANPAGLEKAGGNLWLSTNNAGLVDPYVAPDSDGAASIVSGALEMSNVDLADEFTEMITAQRGFQANTRIITTSDEILQELVNLKR